MENRFLIVGTIKECVIYEKYATLVISSQNEFKNKEGNYDVENIQVKVFKKDYLDLLEKFGDTGKLVSVIGRIHCEKKDGKEKCYYTYDLFADKIYMMTESKEDNDEDKYANVQFSYDDVVL